MQMPIGTSDEILSERKGCDPSAPNVLSDPETKQLLEWYRKGRSRKTQVDLPSQWRKEARYLKVVDTACSTSARSLTRTTTW